MSDHTCWMLTLLHRHIDILFNTPLETVVCSTAHPSISWQWLPAITHHCVKMVSWPWVICHHFSCLLCVFLLWNESRYILLAFLHCSSLSLAIVCPKEEEEVVYRRKQFTPATQVKYEKWFSVGFLLCFLLSASFKSRILSSCFRYIFLEFRALAMWVGCILHLNLQVTNFYNYSIFKLNIVYSLTKNELFNNQKTMWSAFSNVVFRHFTDKYSR